LYFRGVISAMGLIAPKRPNKPARAADYIESSFDGLSGVDEALGSRRHSAGRGGGREDLVARSSSGGIRAAKDPATAAGALAELLRLHGAGRITGNVSERPDILLGQRREDGNSKAVATNPDANRRRPSGRPCRGGAREPAATLRERKKCRAHRLRATCSRKPERRGRNAPSSSFERGAVSVRPAICRNFDDRGRRPTRSLARASRRPARLGTPFFALAVPLADAEARLAVA